MKYFDWNELKNTQLGLERGVTFDDVKLAIEEGKVIKDKIHPNTKRYPNQRILVVDINNYAYLVPYVEDEQKIFFKTIIPSRKATRDDLKKPKREGE